MERLSGTESFIEVFTGELTEEAGFVIRVDEVFHITGKSLEKFAAGPFDLECLTLVAGPELDEVVGEGVEVKNGEVVTGEGFGDGGERVRMVVNFHSGLDIADADDDLVFTMVVEGGNFHVDIGWLFSYKEPIGYSEGVFILKGVENVVFCEAGEEAGKVVGIYGLFCILAADSEEIISPGLNAEVSIAWISRIFKVFVGICVDDINAEIITGKGFGDPGISEDILLFDLIYFFFGDLVIDVGYSDNDMPVVIGYGVYGFELIVIIFSIDADAEVVAESLVYPNAFNYMAFIKGVDESAAV